MIGWTLQQWQAAYRNGDLTPVQAMKELAPRLHDSERALWIHLLDESSLIEQANALTDSSLPLYGIPFAVKDNIDVAGIATTAAAGSRRRARLAAPGDRARGQNDAIRGALETVRDTEQTAIDIADDNKGALAALLAAVVLWFARNPILEMLGFASDHDGADRADDADAEH